MVKCSTKYLREIPPRLFNSIIRTFLEKGSPIRALLQFKSMLAVSAFRPDHRTLALLLKASRNSSSLKTTLQVHGRVIRLGFESCRHLGTSLFRLYLNHDQLFEAGRLFEVMPVLDDDPVCGNLMIMGLLKIGDVEKAYRIFRGMPSKDLVSYNSMITGFARSSQPKCSITLLRRMLELGFEPDGFTFSSALSACVRVGALRHGEWVHGLMAERCIELNHLLCSALIDMYAKCGKIEVAKCLFQAVKRDHVSIWNSMITGLAIHGLGSDAINMFAMMEGEGVGPDGITFLGVLTACSHCGMVQDCRHYFDLMKTRYAIEPMIVHYGAMVDALGRAGHLDAAYETIKAMPIEPDIAIWRSLLSACRKHCRTDLGELAIEQMKQRESGDYVLLSSIYTSAKKWDCAERVWGTMRKEGIRKGRGLSWVELGSKVHQFKAGDRSHNETEGIYRVLDELTKRVKAEGFVPSTELVTMDVSEEEKQENLNSHSEKLAIAYGILKTSPETEIMVSKNLRTCRDCHEWVKLVSKTQRRTIILRDRIRFHCFEGGSCSCKDYW